MDRLSSLPHDILCKIISSLPTKNAVATSILSSRWTNLWISLPILDFDSSLFLRPTNYQSSIWEELFVDFVDKVLSRNHSPSILIFRLHYSKSSGMFLSSIGCWLRNVSLRDVEEFDLEIFHCSEVDLKYLRIPPCESVKILKIHTSYPLLIPTSGCFPNLRILDLKVELGEDAFADYELLTKLVSSLPGLEKLSLRASIKSPGVEFDINIIGTALKSLCMRLEMLFNGFCESKVFIDAPHLEYLSLEHDLASSYSLKNQPAISKVNLDFAICCSECYSQINLLQEICNAKFLSISAKSLLEDNIPVFQDLTKLELRLDHGHSWKIALHLLEKCPNLEILVIKTAESAHYRCYFDHHVNCEREFAPTCLLFNLKIFDVSRLKNPAKREALKYLLENAKVLEQIIVV